MEIENIEDQNTERESHELIRENEKRIVFASLENLQKIVKEHSFHLFVWECEGTFAKMNFNFNSKFKDFSPILVDVQTANMLLTVYEALKNKQEFEAIIKRSRYQFAKMVEFGWSCIK